MSTPLIEQEQHTATEIAEIRKEMERWVQIDAQIKALEAERKDITRWVADRVKTKATWQNGTETYTVTVVRPATPEVDLAALKAADPKAYSLLAVTKEVVDRDALNQMIDLGFFSPGTEAAQTLTYRSSSPSLRFKVGSITALKAAEPASDE